MSRAIKPVSLPLELNEIADKFIDNFSEYVQDCIKRDFTKEYLQKLNEIDLEKIKKRKKIMKELMNDKKTIKLVNLPEKEKLFFEETREILKRDPTFLQGRWNFYKNTFGKTISIKKFRELVDGKS